MAAEQRRSRKIAMNAEELDAFLSNERTCRVATVGANGDPHNTPLWFVWSNGSLWLNSIVSSQRWTDLMRNGRMAVIVDAGEDYMELRGVELLGTAAPIGEIPRTGESHPELEAIEQAFADKYAGGHVARDGRHGWLRMTPDKIVSWDFRKMGK